MHHVCAGEVNDAIAVRMAVGKVNYPNLFPVEMNGQRLVESNHRQSFFRRRRSSALEEFRLLFSRKSLPNVCLRNDWSFGTKNHVAASVIAMPMCIKNKFQLAFAQAF